MKLLKLFFLLFIVNIPITACVILPTKNKEIKLVQYYHIDKKKLYDEVSKILNEIDRQRSKKVDIERAHKLILTITRTYKQGSSEPIYPIAFTIVKYTGFESLRGSDYVPPRGELKSCKKRVNITSGVTISEAKEAPYSVSIFATSNNGDIAKYDLRKMNNICFQASSSSMVFGTIESNLIKVE